MTIVIQPINLRRKRDSNPRTLADQQFSRLPPSTTRPFLQYFLRACSFHSVFLSQPCSATPPRHQSLASLPPAAAKALLPQPRSAIEPLQSRPSSSLRLRNPPSQPVFCNPAISTLPPKSRFCNPALQPHFPIGLQI